MPLSISAPVGLRGANRRNDVATVQGALAGASRVLGLQALHPGPVDGRPGDGTEGAIAAFQRLVCHTRRPDGRIDPGGRTADTLGRVLALGEADWTFPLSTRADAAYYGPGGGMRAFRASRSSGRRAHAGCDLYRPVGTPVYAVAPGRVLSTGPFYLRTNAVVVAHPLPGGGGYVVRYGEVDPNVPVRPGELVEQGQMIGRVGQMVLGNGRPFHLSMVHFELFLGNEGGALTRRVGSAVDRVHNRSFARRRDICDPTALLARAPLR